MNINPKTREATRWRTSDHHASEDKDDFVRPLAAALKAESEFKVWYDEYELKLGDPLRTKIDEGLRSCDYGVVVLSPYFFAKNWPQDELDGLFSLETKERKVILPIWKGVTLDEVRKYSQILAGRLGVSTDRGIEKVVCEIKRSVGLAERVTVVQQTDRMRKFDELERSVTLQREIDALNSSPEGVNQVRTAAREIIAGAQTCIEQISERSKLFALKLKPEFCNADRVFVQGVNGVTMNFYFDATANNSVRDCELNVDFYQGGGSYEKPKLLDKLEFEPWFDETLRVCWRGHGANFMDQHRLLDYVFESFRSVLGRVLVR